MRTRSAIPPHGPCDDRVPIGGQRRVRPIADPGVPLGLLNIELLQDARFWRWNSIFILK